jgi:hypothetical protein
VAWLDYCRLQHCFAAPPCCILQLQEVLLNHQFDAFCCCLPTSCQEAASFNSGLLLLLPLRAALCCFCFR